VQYLLYKKGTRLMKALNISEVRNTLPALIDAVYSTHVPVTVLKYGKPAAMIVPITAEAKETDKHPLRKLPIKLAKDFDAPLDEMWSALGVAEAAGQYDSTRNSKASPKSKRRLS
jgi:prevent-host-death family protein